MSDVKVTVQVDERTIEKELTPEEFNNFVAGALWIAIDDSPLTWRMTEDGKEERLNELISWAADLHKAGVAAAFVGDES